MNTSIKVQKNLPNEMWKDIPEYKGIYQISNMGRIKSLKRTRVKNDRILEMSLCGGGYYRVNLKINGKGKTARVHTLVAKCFLNHSYNEDKKVVDHINNDKLDNRLENLQIITQRKNTSKDKKGYTSKYVGVYWYSPRNRWGSSITFNGKQIYIGIFKKEYDAHLAYQNKLKEITQNQ